MLCAPSAAAGVEKEREVCGIISGQQHGLVHAGHVDQVHPVPGRDQHVFGLDVAVAHVRSVKLIQALHSAASTYATASQKDFQVL